MLDPVRTRFLDFRRVAPLLLFVAWCGGSHPGLADSGLVGTEILRESRPLDEVMVAGIDRFALQEISKARSQRALLWKYDYRSRDSYEASIAPHRARFATRIGVVGSRLPAHGIEYLSSSIESSLVAENDQCLIHAVRWPVLDGMTAEGLWLLPKRAVVARVVALPDADWTPEMVAGIEPCDSSFAGDLAAHGCEVLIPTLINRDYQFSKNESIGRSTNLSHREFIYRQAFELGRHVIGFEVQKVLAAVDQFQLRSRGERELPIAVVGVGEGGLLALYSAAVDNRIDTAVVSGYFDQREQAWAEPIDRNVWGLLSEFGDAEIASLIAPRRLYVETASLSLVDYPVVGVREVAAPGTITPPKLESVSVETTRAAMHWEKIKMWSDEGLSGFLHRESQGPGRMPLTTAATREILAFITGTTPSEITTSAIGPDQRKTFSADQRQGRQVKEMSEYCQRLLRYAHLERDERFGKLDRSSVDAFVTTAESLRQQVHEDLIGKLPNPTMPSNPRSRQVLSDPDYQGYEVTLDVYPDVIAAGILLVPTDLEPDERRPVVVCQHGLEGVPMQTIGGPDTDRFRNYKAFSVELVKQGYIVYAPQNPYRGGDAFRTLQRKSNLLGRSLFSYIIPQHLVTLRWLSTLPFVDRDRIGFYGLSYGGKTAMRVPPLLVPTDSEPGYCLSICSGDFNEWVAKNVSTDARNSYVWTGEYEISEWNMGHIANYAELAMLMTPRPFMVERGHDDGVAIDEWVAWEFAKVRRHYNKLGIGDRVEIEYFDGPHTIHGQGTYRFLDKHLK